MRARRISRTGRKAGTCLDLTPKNVYIVDCDEVNNSDDFPKGHSYFRSGRTPGKPGVVFDHIFECLRTGRVASDDAELRATILRE